MLGKKPNKNIKFILEIKKKHKKIVERMIMLLSPTCGGFKSVEIFVEKVSVGIGIS